MEARFRQRDLEVLLVSMDLHFQESKHKRREASRLRVWQRQITEPGYLLCLAGIGF
jgi:hypothetical protein